MPDLFGESVVRFPEERRCGRRENFSPSGSAVCVQFWKKRNGYCLSRVRLIKLLSCPEDLFFLGGRVLKVWCLLPVRGPLGGAEGDTSASASRDSV